MWILSSKMSISLKKNAVRLSLQNTPTLNRRQKQKQLYKFYKMQSSKNVQLLLPLCVAFIFGATLVDLACNVCQENGAACMNLTSYHLCFGDPVPNKMQLFICPDGLECTNLPNICFQSSTRPASCGDISSCGQCNANQVFACTSRTTFAFCFGATTPSDVLGSCPEGRVCDASSPNFCVKEVHADSIICDLETNTTIVN